MGGLYTPHPEGFISEFHCVALDDKDNEVNQNNILE